MLKNVYLLIFCFATSLIFGEVYDPITVYLTWTKNPESTMSIQWISKKFETDDTILYRPLTSQDDDVCLFKESTGRHINMPDGHPYLIHYVELKDLKPNTAYEFKIGQEGVLFKFKTIPDTLTEIKFVEGGDVYHDDIDNVLETNVQAAKLNPMFAILGGDIAYSADSSYGIFPEDVYRWLKFLVTWKKSMITKDGFLIPIVPAIGNHETSGGFGKGPGSAPFFYAFFPFPGKQGYNVLDFGKYLSLIMLDSGHTHPIEGDQRDWLEATLKKREKVLYKFAVYHVPAYPAARRHTYGTSMDIRKNWVPLFDKYSLKTAFEHHDHVYKRTHLLKKGKIHNQGVLYLGDGAWGVEKPRKPRRGNPFMAKTVSSRNFILVTLDPSSAKYEAFNEKGEIIDRVIQQN